MRTAVKLQDEAPEWGAATVVLSSAGEFGALLLRQGSAAESVAVFSECLRGLSGPTIPER